MGYPYDQKHIGFEAIIFAVYVALTPIHQTLVLSSGGTITKYLALGTMLVCLISGLGRFHFDQALVGRLILLAVWFGVTTIWSRSVSTTVSSLSSIYSYFALLLVVGSKQWTQREKQLLSIALLISVTVISLLLIQSSATQRRATIAWSGSEQEADQNVLAANIGMGIPFAIHYYLTTARKTVRFLMLGVCLIVAVGIISTGSRGALLAAFAAMLYYLISSRRIERRNRLRLFLIVTAILLLVCVVLSRNILHNDSLVSRYTTAMNDTSGRTEIWKEYFPILGHRPRGIAIGYGYGAGGLEYGDFYQTRWPPATHNDFLSILMGTGLVGLLFAANLVLHVWKKSESMGNSLGCACIILALTAGLSVNFFNRYGWWNAMIFAYIGIGALQNGEEEKQSL